MDIMHIFHVYKLGRSGIEYSIWQHFIFVYKLYQVTNMHRHVHECGCVFQRSWNKLSL